MEMRAAVASLGVSNIRFSMRFYREHFGFDVVESYAPDGEEPVWCRLRSGAAEIMLQQLGESQMPSLVSAETPSSWVLYLNTTDIRACRATFDHFVYPASDIEATEYGTEEFYVTDLDGYEIWVSASF
jgi:uncharacterized glyoxalase superfamily protein PhnB